MDWGYLRIHLLFLPADAIAPAQKNAQVIYVSTSITKSMLQKMSEKIQLKGCIYEVNFGYNGRMTEYANLSSDITKLCEIVSGEVLIK